MSFPFSRLVRRRAPSRELPPTIRPTTGPSPTRAASSNFEELGDWSRAKLARVTLQVACTAYNPAALGRVYFGGALAQPTATQGQSYLVVPRDGVIGQVQIQAVAAVAGSGEAWVLHLAIGTRRLEIQSVAASRAVRTWKADLGVRVAKGDQIEVLSRQPSWSTLPTGVTFSGFIYIE